MTKTLDYLKKNQWDFIDEDRYKSGEKIFNSSASIDVESVAHDQICFSVRGSVRTGSVPKHKVKIEADLSNLEGSCTCTDWLINGKKNGILCKHICACLMYTIENELKTPDFISAEKWHSTIEERVSKAIVKIAEKLKQPILERKTTYVYGQTGTGKTSAILHLASLKEFKKSKLVMVKGNDSWQITELVGIQWGDNKHNGPLQRALHLAKNNHVILFVDELRHFSPNVQSAFIELNDVVGPVAAIAMGIDSKGEDIRVIETPLQERLWCPAKNLSIVYASNPWGSRLDSAFIRRIEVIFEVNLDKEVLGIYGDSEIETCDIFSAPVAEIVFHSWKASSTGALDLPIEYKSILNSKGRDDPEMIETYILKLQQSDPNAAEGFIVLAQSLGIQMGQFTKKKEVL